MSELSFIEEAALTQSNKLTIVVHDDSDGTLFTWLKIGISK